MISIRWILILIVFLPNPISSKGSKLSGDRTTGVVGGGVATSTSVTPEDQQKCTQNCLESKLDEKCPTTLQETYLVNYLPNGNGNSSTGVTRTLLATVDLEGCVTTCCQVDICNFAIFKNNSCLLFFCTNGVDLCMPQPAQVDTLDEVDLKLILVRPPVENKRRNSSCETGADTDCHDDEECFPKNTRSRNGFCGCRQTRPQNEYIYNNQGVCQGVPTEATLDILVKDLTAIEPASKLTPPTVVKTLEVSVVSKNVTLPENEANLYAYAVPQSPPDRPYSYEWKLIAHPENDPAVTEGQTTAALHLTRLIQGSYMFQVTVKGQNATGAANATINVNPAKRTNQIPIAIISPPQQTIQLPTNSAVLDGTSSTDDDKIVSYKWELQKGPINYPFSNGQQNSPTLQINDLVPGNYTFKLSVEDVDHATNATTANVTVMKEIDYPPTANAGKDIVIYLPQTEVMLNGNASTDDKGIVQWEWKATGDVKKAVDMQDTHSAYLKLSGLDEGLYQFELTVTDEAGQVSNPSVVHLFVKKPTGNPPKADAGVDQTIALPQTWVVLDASGSKADSKVLKWQWSQLSGPNNVTLTGGNEVKVNVSGLTKGDYEFQVLIEDDAKLTARDNVSVVVTQKTNEPPKANAGKDVTVTLPVSFVQLDGSESKDDVEITEWKWERQEDSLAAGIVLGDSDTSSKLKLADLVPGKYVFKLRVKDEQQLMDEDTVTLLVVEDPVKKSLIQVVLGVTLPHLTESDKERFLQKMALLVHDTRLVFHHITGQSNSEFSTIYLYGINAKNETREPLGLSTELRDKLRRDVGLLDVHVESIDTLLCLNPCSGHGTCQDFSTGRECVCQPFWMQNYIKRHFGNGEVNCDWSKIYVGVIVCCLLLMKLSIIWSLVYLFRRNARILRSPFNNDKLETGFLNGTLRNGSSRRNHGGRGNTQTGTSSHKNKQYALLDDDEEEDELEMEIRAGEPGSDESESDESLIFERGKDGGSKGVSVSLLKPSPQSHIPSSSSTNSNGLPRINGILKKPRPAGIKA